MRRLLIGAGVVGALAFAAVALGAAKHYEGPITGGGKVTFDANVKHGVAKRVQKGFLFSGIDIKCDEGTIHNISNQGFPVPAMNVKRRKFHGNFSQLGGHGHITGKFTNHLKKAHGTLRVNGNPATFHNCDTGTLDWHARRKG